MTDKEYRTTRDRIRKIWKEWRVNLGLRWWQTRVEFVREDNKDHFDCVAKCVVQWEYMFATITCYLPGLAEKNDKDLEETIVHECVHILVNEMREFAPEKLEERKLFDAMKHEERTVTGITNALLWTKYAHKPKEVAKKTKRRGK